MSSCPPIIHGKYLLCHCFCASSICSITSHFWAEISSCRLLVWVCISRLVCLARVDRESKARTWPTPINDLCSCFHSFLLLPATVVWFIFLCKTSCFLLLLLLFLRQLWFRSCGAWVSIFFTKSSDFYSRSATRHQDVKKQAFQKQTAIHVFHLRLYL